MRKITLISFYLLFALFLSKAQTSIPHLGKQNRISGFLENKGQIVDQNYHSNPDVKYLLCNPNFNVQLRQTGFSYDTYTDTPDKTLDKKVEESIIKGKKPENFTRHYHRVDIELVGCNANSEIIAEGRSTSSHNYFTAGTPVGGISNVQDYQKIIYKNIYPNIDLEFLTGASNGGKVPVEYQFVVHPGAKPSDIKLEYKGANSVDLSDNKLIVNVTAGNFNENIPSSYFKDTKQDVKVNYVKLENNIFTFSLPKNIRLSSDLIIDPTPNLQWGTYYGGSGTDSGNGIVLDGANNVYTTGQTSSNTNIATVGTYQTVFSGTSDAFISKFDPTGSTLLWGTYYGGTQLEQSNAIALDASGNIYITGFTASTSGIATVGAYQTASAGSYDVFVAKFDPTGSSLLWGTYYGGGNFDFGWAIVLDALNNVFISGATYSGNGIATVGAYNTGGGYNPAFVAKFDPSGSSLLWGTYFGGPGNNTCTALGLDGSGNVCFAGHTQSPGGGIVTVGAYQTFFGGGNGDIFVAKLDPTGSTLIWGTYYGGGAYEDATAMAIDASDNVYITGGTGSPTGIATVGAYQTAFNNCGTFIAKFDPTGSSLIWGTYYGANPGGNGSSLALDASDNVYLTGVTSSTTAISTVGAYQTTYGGGGGDAYVAKFDPTGSSLLWASYYGGTGTEDAYGLKLDASNNVYITGQTASPNAIATVGAYQTSFGGTNNSFVAKFTDCGAVPNQPIIIYGAITVCNGSIVKYKIDSVPGATSYTWTLPVGWTGTSSIDSIFATVGSTGGTITVIANNACGSSIVQSLTVTVNNVAATITSVNDSCNGNCDGTATVNPTGTGPFTYLWSNAATTSVTTALCVGSYTATVTGAAGCTAIQTVNITQPIAITSTITTININCNGANNGSATVNASGGTGTLNYNWNSIPSQTTANATGLGVGSYTCTITDANGCTQIQTINITEPPPIISSDTSISTTCGNNNGSATVNASGGTGTFTYSWNTVPSQTGTTATGLGAGNYFCTVTDANGCTQVANTVVVLSSTGPTAIAGPPNDTIPFGSTVVLNSSGGLTFSWSPANSLSCTTCPNPTAGPTITTTYTVTVTDVNGCTSTATVTITVDLNCEEIFIANAFSPNGDGINDTLCVHGTCILSFDFIIYDRWGEKVFETTDQHQCWDGIYKGQKLNDGAYFYSLDAFLITGKNVRKKGDISLIR